MVNLIMQAILSIDYDIHLFAVETSILCKPHYINTNTSLLGRGFISLTQEDTVYCTYARTQYLTVFPALCRPIIKM